MTKKEDEIIEDEVEQDDETPENIDENVELDNLENDAYNDDVVYDEEATPNDQMKKLRDKLKQCQKEKQEYLDGWQRVKADMVNQKKNFEAARKEYVNYANEQFIEEFFPVLDSYQMAFSDIKAWESVPETWRKGIEYIYSQFTGVLENHSWKLTEPIGELFDPMLHNSIESVNVEDEKDDHKIVGVIQKGYSINGKVVRPAKVKVGVFNNKNEGDEK